MTDVLIRAMADRPEWMAGWFLGLIAACVVLLVLTLWALFRLKAGQQHAGALHSQQVQHLEQSLTEQRTRSAKL